MSSEVKIHDDPRTYDPRNIFGALTKRGAAAIAAVVLAVTAGLGLSARLGLDPTVVGALAMLLGLAAGAGIVSKSHGLHSEKWIPIVMAERSAAKDRLWEPPRPVVDREAPAQTARERRRERRRLKAEARARSLEREGDPVLGAGGGEPHEV